MKKSKSIVLFLFLIVLLGLAYVKTDGGKQIKGIKIEDNELSGPHIRATFLDVGQGDATLLRFPDGSDMLIDCGKDSRVLTALGRALPSSDKTIEYLIITHPDLDHYGGCIDVLNRFDVKMIAYTGYEKEEGGAYDIFLEKAEGERAVTRLIQKREMWDIASTTVDFLYPDHDAALDPSIPGIPTKDESNNTSLIMRIALGTSDMLLTGDMGVDLETHLVKTYGDILDVDVLKVGHHGSAGSSGEEFLSAVTPDYAVISVGKNNGYGHPTARVLKRLERVGATILRTDEMGDISFLLTGDSVEEQYSNESRSQDSRKK